MTNRTAVHPRPRTSHARSSALCTNSICPCSRLPSSLASMPSTAPTAMTDNRAAASPFAPAITPRSAARCPGSVHCSTCCRRAIERAPRVARPDPPGYAPATLAQGAQEAARDAEHLEYFKAALEGRASVGWNVWFAANQQALSQQLSRPALLRLKFNQLDEAERLLAEAGIVPASTAGKRYEMYCAQFALDVLDEKGRPLPAIWRAAHGGAIGLLADGEHEAGQAKLLAEFRRVRKRGLQQAHEWLADLCFEGEMELTSGNAEVGRSLLAVVVQAGSGHDLLDATSMIARELLDEHG